MRIPNQFSWEDMKPMFSPSELSLFAPHRWTNRLKQLREWEAVRTRWDLLCFNNTVYQVPLPPLHPLAIGDQDGLADGELEALGLFRDFVYQNGYDVLKQKPERDLPIGVHVSPGVDKPSFAKSQTGKLVFEMLTARTSKITSGAQITIKGEWEKEIVMPEDSFHNPSDELIVRKFQDWRMSTAMKRDRDYKIITEIIDMEDVHDQKWIRENGRSRECS